MVAKISGWIIYCSIRVIELPGPVLSSATSDALVRIPPSLTQGKLYIWRMLLLRKRMTLEFFSFGYRNL